MIDKTRALLSNELQTYVSSKLHEILNLSEQATIDCIIAIAKKAKSKDAIVSGLKSIEFPDSPATQTFASELFSKIHPAATSKEAPKLSEYQLQEKKALEQVEKGKQYKIVKEDRSLEKSIVLPPQMTANKTENLLDSTRTSFFQETSQLLDSLEKKGESNLSIEERKEMKKLLKERDRIEKEELHKRILERDLSTAKQIAKPAESAAKQEKWNLPYEERMRLIAELREKSRCNSRGKKWKKKPTINR